MEIESPYNSLFKEINKGFRKTMSKLNNDELIFNYSKCLAMEISNCHSFFQKASLHIFKELWSSLPPSE